jgi:hypothetical protein
MKAIINKKCYPTTIHFAVFVAAVVHIESFALTSYSTTSSTQSRHNSPVRLRLLIDPINVISLIGSTNDIIHASKSVVASGPLGQSIVNELLVYTSTGGAAAIIQRPASGHSQPLWGPQDPILSAGRSIPPSMDRLSDMGIVQQQLSDLPESVQQTIKAGYKALDASTIQQNIIMPGFLPTGGILPMHNPRVPAETPATFALQVEWSAKFLNVIDKLPEAAFVYALVEFFILRPGLDLYKEDIDSQQEEGATGVLTAETLAVTGVRLGVFLVIAILTNIIFGG